MKLFACSNKPARCIPAVWARPHRGGNTCGMLRTATPSCAKFLARKPTLPMATQGLGADQRLCGCSHTQEVTPVHGLPHGATCLCEKLRTESNSCARRSAQKVLPVRGPKKLQNWGCNPWEMPKLNAYNGPVRVRRKRGPSRPAGFCQGNVYL